MEFCAIESCGNCTPCRIGSTAASRPSTRSGAGDRVPENIAVIEDLCNTMKFGSLCAWALHAYPVMSALKHSGRFWCGTCRPASCGIRDDRHVADSRKPIFVRASTSETI